VSDPGEERRSGRELADEVERAGTTRTPFLALTGVWLAIAVTFVLVLAIALTVYLAARD
jgi:hypothetical protein